MKRRPLTTRSIWIYYYRYKDTIYFAASVFVLVLGVGVILFMQLILPQVQKWFSIREEVLATRERIATIQDNSLKLSQMNDAKIERDMQTAVATYPSEKDYVGVLAAISEASIKANISLDDYSFTVGSLATQSAKMQQNELQPIEVEVELIGDANGVMRFIKEVQESIPLSEMVSVVPATEQTKVKLVFPYKIFGKLEYNVSDPIKELTPQEQALISKLESWRPESDDASFVSQDNGTIDVSPTPSL